MFYEKIKQIAKRIKENDHTRNIVLKEKVLGRLNGLTKPPGSLGRLEDFVLRYCLCRRDEAAQITKSQLYVFAADHGITAEGVSLYPAEVTSQMVLNMLAGGAAINVMCKNAGIDCRIVDVGVNAEFEDHPLLHKKKVAQGTASFLRQAAMTKEQCDAALQAGYELAGNSGADILGTGEMGIGNTSSSSALYALLLGKKAETTVGAGTGAKGKLLEQKTKVLIKALKYHKKRWDRSAFDALRRVGGFEIAAMAGFMIGAAEHNIPVVVDGFIAGAAALTAITMVPCTEDYLFFAHKSAEKFHAAFLKALKKKPVLDLGLRLGEGTGSVLAIMLIRQALNCYHQMASFSEAGVSDRK